MGEMDGVFRHLCPSHDHELGEKIVEKSLIYGLPFPRFWSDLVFYLGFPNVTRAEATAIPVQPLGA